MSKLRRADWLAGAAGVFLIVTLFLPWYGVTTSFRANDRPAPHASAWQAFTVVDVLLALLALLALAVPVVTAAASGPAKPVAFAVLSSVGSVLAVLLVLWRLVDTPGDHLALRYGAWLGLLAALLMFAACVGTMRYESTPGVPPPDIPRRPAP